MPGKVLILGGRGFIGSHVLDELVGRGVPVRVFGRPRSIGLSADIAEGTNPLLEVVEGDLNNEVDVDTALSGCEACIHAVTTTLPKSSNNDPAFDVQTNLVGTLNLLRLCRTHRLSRLVFLSSGGTVYGPPRYLPIDEDHPTNPQSSYGVVKLAIEKYLDIASRQTGLRCLVLRLSNPFGERQRPTLSHGAVAVFLTRALRQQRIEIWGDGSVTRDYLYVGDCARAIVAALDYDGPETVFNIGSGSERSLNDLLRSITTLLGRPPEVVYKDARTFDVARSVLSIERAKRELAWHPGTDFEAALERTARWLRGETSGGQPR